MTKPVRIVIVKEKPSLLATIARTILLIIALIVFILLGGPHG